MGKKCVQLVGKPWHNQVDKLPQLPQLATRAAIANVLLHKTFHQKQNYAQAGRTIESTGYLKLFNLLGMWFSTISTQPTITTTIYI